MKSAPTIHTIDTETTTKVFLGKDCNDGFPHPFLLFFFPERKYSRITPHFLQLHYCIQYIRFYYGNSIVKVLKYTLNKH